MEILAFVTDPDLAAGILARLSNMIRCCARHGTMRATRRCSGR